MKCISGHFGFSSDKDDRLIPILLDHFRRLKSVPVIQNFKNVLRLGYTRADVLGYTFKKGVYYHAQLEEKGFAGW